MLSHEVGEYRRAAGTDVLRIACYVVAVVSFGWFLFDAFARGWSQTTTDFPNYYTAARLTPDHAPLRSFYSYPAFQREIGRAGVGMQLGGYIPQTPLTMVPLIPLASLKPLQAKRAWLVLNLGFLGLTLWLLSSITRFNLVQLWLAVFLGYGALRQNFVLGQYYVLLLAILTVAVYGLLRSFERSAGAAFASAFSLKLYGAPFLLFLAAKRQFRATGAFIVAALLSLAFATAMFGWDAVTFYATQVLPRSLAGETLNPYHPGINTFTTLLRELFIAEPELNPHPLLNSPAAFVFLQCAFTLTILLVPVLAAWNRPGPATRTDLAWWSIVLLLVSPNTALYTFVLLVVPVVLLLDELPRRHWLYILVPYFFLALPLRPPWDLLFPKAWLLLFLFLRVGLDHLKLIDRTVAAFAAAGILVACCGAAILTTKFPEEPAALARPIATQQGAIYASSPVVTATGIFYETIAYESGAQERYAVRHWDGNRFETVPADFHAFHPSAPDSGVKVYFERFSSGRSSIALFDFETHRHETVTTGLPDPREPAISHDGRTLAFVTGAELYVSDGHSSRKLGTQTPARDPSFESGDRKLLYVGGKPPRWQIVRIDLATGENEMLIDDATELASPSISPDHKRLAYASLRTGSWQVWIKDLASRRDVEVTKGRCNSMAPAWALDSLEIVFSSDCKRGLNLPALFSMPVGRSSATAILPTEVAVASGFN